MVSLLFDGAIPVVANASPDETMPPAERMPPGEALKQLTAGYLERHVDWVKGSGAKGFSKLHDGNLSLSGVERGNHYVPKFSRLYDPAQTAAIGLTASPPPSPPASPPPCLPPPSPPPSPPRAHDPGSARYVGDGYIEADGLGRYPRLGAFEVVLRSPGGLFVPLHSKAQTSTFPSVERLGARLLQAMGQPADHLVLLRDSRHLHRAAASGEVAPMLRLLHAAPNEIASADENGEQPLHIACAHGRIQIIDLLLKWCAPIDDQAIDGGTPLLRAAAHGHTTCVKRLIDAAATISTKDASGNTALHLAVRHGSVSCVNVLVDAGAQRTETDARGKTPLDLVSDPVLKATRSADTTQALRALLASPEAIAAVNGSVKETPLDEFATEAPPKGDDLPSAPVTGTSSPSRKTKKDVSEKSKAKKVKIKDVPGTS